MNLVEQEIVLQTAERYGRDVPLSLSSALLHHLEATTKPCVRMAFEGTSSSVGANPSWLERAIDIRTLGFSLRHGETVLHLKAPRLGDAAPKLFEQQSLFPGVTSPEDTALQIVGRIVQEIRREDRSSDLYDRSLLNKISKWQPLLDKGLQSVAFPDGNHSKNVPVALDLVVAANARSLSQQTPEPRQVRIVGKLDMVRHSTRSFELLLATGEPVRGVLVDGTADALQKHFGNQITVLGKAIYRPSGTLLRLDASEILDTTEGREAFSLIPSPLTVQSHIEKKLQSQKTGVSAFFGIWPGDESDHQLIASLAEIRR